MSLRLYSLGCSVIGLGLWACDGKQTPTESTPISHSSAALTLEANTERALRGLIDSSSHLTHSKALVRLLSSLGGSSTVCSSYDAAPVSCLDGTNCDTTPPVENCVTETNDVTEEDLEELQADLHEGVDELLQSLREEVFIDENLESDDGKTVVYKLGPSVLCDDMPTAAPMPGQPETVTSSERSTDTDTATATDTSAEATTPVDANYDAECVADLEKWVPRLQLASPREGDVDVTLLLTDQRISPLTLNLYQNRLGVTLDLGKLEASATRAGKPLEGVTGLAGILSANLIQNGNLNYTLDLSVSSMVKMLLGDGPEKFSISLAPSPKALTLNIDGNAGRISGRLDVSAFKLSAPLAAFMSEEDNDASFVVGPNGELSDPVPTQEKSYHGNIEGYLAGLSGNFSHDQSGDVLSWTNIGLGSETSYVKFEQSTLLSLDINATRGRVFDLYVDGRGEEGPSLQFSPGLDVDVLLGFAAIADQVTDIEQYFLNDRLKLRLTGDKPTLLLESEQVRVTSGSLELVSELHSGYRTVVEAGMCLVDGDPQVKPPTLLGELVSSTCE